jgi:hypothetical protein
MLQIKTPDIYINEPGAIELLGSYVSVVWDEWIRVTAGPMY